MKTLLLAISALLLAGCESSRTNTTVTAEQAGALCVQLANDKADAVYHRRPFENKQTAQFEDGRWVWTGSQGVGILDYQATVELAANGSTNNVDVRLTDDALHAQTIVPNNGLPPAPVPPYFRK
jgi:hypothetical protein